MLIWVQLWTKYPLPSYNPGWPPLTPSSSYLRDDPASYYTSSALVRPCNYPQILHLTFWFSLIYYLLPSTSPNWLQPGTVTFRLYRFMILHILHNRVSVKEEKLTNDNYDVWFRPTQKVSDLKGPSKEPGYYICSVPDGTDEDTYWSLYIWVNVIEENFQCRKKEKINDWITSKMIFRNCKVCRAVQGIFRAVWY